MPLSIPVPPEAAGERIDRFLASRLAGVSRSRIQRWLEEGRARIDPSEGAAPEPKASLLLKEGWTIVLDVPEAMEPVLEPAPVPVHVVHEDDEMMVVSKQPGISVHPGAGRRQPTLVQGLIYREPDHRWPGSPERPGIVHRLDRDTSGLLVIARTDRAYLSLQQQISRREAQRRYVALVWGIPEAKDGSIEAPIGRDPRARTKMAVVPRGGRPARTRYRLLRSFGAAASLLEIALDTGRTHQIRVHMEHAGFPVFGDPSYGGAGSFLSRLSPAERPAWARRLRRLNRQALHAYHLTVRHPGNDRRWIFESPLPDDLEELLQDLSRESTGAIGEGG
ncbi:MAG: RluA family pseudouridine synthase [Candidatus Eisenbacteria bacterium]|nr:RluA family pseudouridine synthase [Candidatus Eisenbacteria bacterium]